MSNFESYFLLWVDSFINNFSLSIAKPIVLQTMLFFGYNSFLVISVYITAVISACLANYILGKVLYNIFVSLTKNKPHNYNKTKNIAQILLYIIAPILAFINMTRFLVVFLGFMHISFLRAIIFPGLIQVIVVVTEFYFF